ncbi:MAG: hypothetical protein QM706_03305 [Nitrospira sp.]
MLNTNNGVKILINEKMRIFKELIKFAYNDKESDLKKIITPEEYLKLFEGPSLDSSQKMCKAYEKAWDARKFEIENYWKRTTYFWAFQVTAFAAYLAILNSDSYKAVPPKNPSLLFCAIAFGLITSLAWALINIGSKFWQRHWEKHIDMLEDKITGPLYKTVYAYKSVKTFSVSKINDIISRFFTVIWVVLVIKYVVDNITFKGSWKNIAYIEILVTLFIIYFVMAMFWGHGRGNFGRTDFEFHERRVFKI